MADEKNEPSGFKVVDRRSFNSEGSRREDEAPPVSRAEAPNGTTAARPARRRERLSRWWLIRPSLKPLRQNLRRAFGL